MIYEWLISNIDRIIQASVAGGTLLLGIIAYLQMRESKVEIHTKGLIELVNKWSKELPEVKDAEVTPASGYNIDALFTSSFSIEKHALFSDIFHHVPSLKNIWVNFKNLNDEYNLKQSELFQKIDEYVKQSKKFNFNGSIPAISLSVYLESFCSTKNKESGFEYLYEDPAIRRGRLDYYNRSNGIKYNLARGGQEIQTVEIIHKEIIDECRKQNLKEIKHVIELEGKLKSVREELKKKLNEMSYYTGFDNMNCKFVPNFRRTLRDAF